MAAALAALKAQLEQEKKRKLADASASSGNKYMKRGEEEKLKQAKLNETKVAKKPVENPSPKDDDAAPIDKSDKETTLTNNTTSSEAEGTTPTAEQIPPIPREQVISRLRQRGHPITLFGETDWQRYQRLHLLEEHEPHDKIAGMDNEFAKEVKGIDKETNEKDDDDFGVIPHKLGDSLDSLAVMDGANGAGKEEFILVMLKTMLSQWEQELNDRPDLEKRTAQGKVATATYKQCRKHIKPLFKLLRDKHLPQDILDPVHVICSFIKDREYVQANDAYLTMAIGNAPWPMGVTMVGIHERSAREKIFTNQVAHVLNDETQRKYIQAIKRIMTWAQRKYPNDPSKCVG